MLKSLADYYTFSYRLSMPEIFLETSVRVSNEFLSKIISHNHPRDEFFSNLGQEVGVKSTYRKADNGWNLQGDWDSVTKAYNLLSSIHDGEIYSNTAKLISVQDWSSTSPQNSSKWSFKSSPKRGKDGDSEFWSPFIQDNITEDDPDQCKEVEDRDPGLQEDGQTLTTVSGNSCKTSVNFTVPDIGHSIGTKIIDTHGTGKQGSQERDVERNKSNAKHKRLKRELMIDKPLFSVDEIIKNIVEGSGPKEKGKETDLPAVEGQESISNTSRKQCTASSLKIPDIQSAKDKPLDLRSTRQPELLPQKKAIKSKHIRNRTRFDTFSMQRKVHKRKSKPKKVIEIPFLEDSQEDVEPMPETSGTGGSDISLLKQRRRHPGIHKLTATRRGASKDSQLCPKCSKVFSSLSNLYRHMKIAHQGHRYQCEDCDKRFTCNDSLQRHIRIVHEDLRCRDCFIIYHSRTDLDSHPCPGSKATDGATCPQCGKTYSCSSNLNKHIKVCLR